MTTKAEYWDGIAEKFNSYFVENPYFEHKRNEVIRLINRWGNNSQDGIVLKTDLYEEALEPGHFLFGLPRNNKKVYGVDISSKLAKMAAKEAYQRKVHLNLCVSDVRKLAFKDNMFNLIISTSTLDHFPEINVALKELYRVLKPEGVIILILHNANNLPVYLMYKLMKLLKEYPFGYAEGTFGLHRTKQLLRNTGFSVEDSTAIIHVPPFIPTIINEIYRREKSKTLTRLCQRAIVLSEAIGKGNSFLKYFTGYCLAVKGIKR